MIPLWTFLLVAGLWGASGFVAGRMYEHRRMLKQIEVSAAVVAKMHAAQVAID